MNVLINTANILTILRYLTTDMLRLLSIFATSCVVAYFYSKPDSLINVVV